LKLNDLHAILDQAGLLAPTASAVLDQYDLATVEVGSLHYDTRQILPGGVFCAIEGFTTDGHEHIPQALDRGAVAVIAQKPAKVDIPVIQVTNSRVALAVVSDHFFGYPSRELTIVGITGTNGKTTCAYLVENMLVAAGYRVGVIGTVNYRYNGTIKASPVTTPESLDLQHIMAEMVAAGVTHLVLEVSSHAIDLYRIEACQIDIGVFTNLSQDHLDYHGNMQDYWACKKRLFTHYLETNPDAIAVINTDSPEGTELISEVPYTSITTGRKPGSMIRSESMTIDFNGIRGRITTLQNKIEIESILVGAHNLENILSSVGVGVALALPSAAIQNGINTTHSVPGRLERVSNNGDIPVYVDYAHTPDALENVLKALKRLTPDHIITVFGCGGNRDKTKRPLMGNIAAQYSDLAIVTSDNPRSEDPDDIIDQILLGEILARQHAYTLAELHQGFLDPGYYREPDRRKAIQTAIQTAKPGDIVLIAGKGHETYQILGDRTIDFDDRVEAKTALTTRSKEEARR
jgi:UDP-N-acetylmuramyl-tripeptide synthetase